MTRTANQTESVAMRHFKHAKAAGVATACTAHHVNFGGGCLNCGFLPESPAPQPATETQWVCSACGVNHKYTAGDGAICERSVRREVSK